MDVDRLLSIASSPIASPLKPDDTISKDRSGGKRVRELIQMLSMRNGFYAFEAALHVFPWAEPPLQNGFVGIQQWNEKALWRDLYSELIDDMLFFAEDVFGGQFGIKGNDIVSFDPESGEIELLAVSLEDWAGQLMSNYAVLTGYPVAHEWQVAHGPIPIGYRLLPRTPFILGGEFTEKNLCAVDAIQGMRYRGNLWQQIRDLPDGAQVRLKELPLH